MGVSGIQTASPGASVDLSTVYLTPDAVDCAGRLDFKVLYKYSKRVNKEQKGVGWNLTWF